MKQNWIKATVLSLGLALLAPAALMAQKEEKEKDKEVKDKNVQQIIITRKNENQEKVVVEINGDKVTVNGKPLDEYKNQDGDINVRVNKLREMGALTRIPGAGAWSYNGNGDTNFNYKVFGGDENHAMLGVTTERVEGGVQIQEVTKESGAEKAGLKENDVITKIDDTKIEDPDDLSASINKHKPGEKVTVTYLRDKKEQKTTAELSKWKGVGAWTVGPNGNFNMDMKDFMPKIQTMPRMNGQNFSWNGGGPKMGLSVQDTDDGKGVKVIEVDDESNAAKAGIKEDDVLTEVDGKAVNSADEVAKIIRESKEKVSVMMKLQRAGRTQNVEVKIPRKLKTADL